MLLSAASAIPAASPATAPLAFSAYMNTGKISVGNVVWCVALMTVSPAELYIPNRCRPWPVYTCTCRKDGIVSSKQQPKVKAQTNGATRQHTMKVEQKASMIRMHRQQYSEEKLVNCGKVPRDSGGTYAHNRRRCASDRVSEASSLSTTTGPSCDSTFSFSTTHALALAPFSAAAHDRKKLMKSESGR